MNFKKKTLAIASTLLLSSCVVFAATDEETELKQLQLKEKTAQMINQSDEGLEVKYLADGTGYIDLKGRFLMFSKVKIVDGKQVFVCDGNPEVDHHTHQHAIELNKPKPNQVVIKRTAQ